MESDAGNNTPKAAHLGGDSSDLVSLPVGESGGTRQCRTVPVRGPEDSPTIILPDCVPIRLS